MPTPAIRICLLKCIWGVVDKDLGKLVFESYTEYDVIKKDHFEHLASLHCRRDTDLTEGLSSNLRTHNEII